MCWREREREKGGGGGEIEICLSYYVAIIVVSFYHTDGHCNHRNVAGDDALFYDFIEPI